MTIASAAPRPVPPAIAFMRLAALVRARARLTSALILLTFVLCHFLSHIFLIFSVPLAEQTLAVLMQFWWTTIGTVVLAGALTVHALNALWSIYVRRSLRMARWEWAQIAL